MLIAHPYDDDDDDIYEHTADLMRKACEDSGTYA